MRIHKSNPNFNLEHNIRKQNFLPIIDRILLIGKSDPNFSNGSKVNELDKAINLLKERILKQDNLILKSKTMKEDLEKKISIIINENLDTKVILLESLEKGL
jgi:hypothetical protein